jgi:hypothetical protein
MTNREMAKTPGFVNLCEKYNVKPTARQFSKMRLGKGLLVLRRKGLIALNSKHKGSAS